MEAKRTLVGLGVPLMLALSVTGSRGAEAASPPGPPPAADGAKAPAAPKAPAKAPSKPQAQPVAPDSSAPDALKSPPPATPAAQPIAGPGAPAMDGATQTVKLRDLEQRLDDLKEQIRRQYTRLGLLTERIYDGGGGAARATVKFSSELSGVFRVARVLVVLDGAVLYNRTDPVGTQTGPFEIPVFDGLVPPGDHTVQVLVNLQGEGHGIFSYMRGFRFEVRSTHSFTAVEGKTVDLEAVSFEKGTSTTPFEERPALRYGEKIVAGVEALVAPRAGVPR